MLAKMKYGLQIIMGSSLGIYLGCVIYFVMDYVFRQEIYATFSTPWYTQVLVFTAYFTIYFIIVTIIYGLVCHRLNLNHEE